MPSFSLFHNSETAIRLTLSLASTEEMLSWSYGLVSDPNTVTGEMNYPIKNGLLCPRIFGVTPNERCLCSEYNRKGKDFCPICEVDFVSTSAARTRFGHIQLNVPVIHTWFYKVTQSLLSLLTNLTSSDVESLVLYKKHLIKVPFKNYLRGQLISNVILMTLPHKVECNHVVSGPRALLEAIHLTDLTKVKLDLTNQLTASADFKAVSKLTERLSFLENVITNRIKLDRLLLWVLPVLPSVLRPAPPPIGGLHVDSALTSLYSRIITINNDIADSLKSASTSKRLNRLLMFRRYAALQCAVDSLIGSTGTVDKSSEVLNTSLTDVLKGKEGYFRHDLLGRRVDYSGRSVIVPGPKLNLDECAIPFALASELFKPMVIAELRRNKTPFNIRMLKQSPSEPSNLYIKTLRKLVTHYPVILNRAPTLHKLSMLAFKLTLTDTKAIKLHPLVCPGFNADFDGDQVAVHVPISAQARHEAESLLLASRNVLHPAHGGVTISPTKDMVLGLYYLSLISKDKFNHLPFDSEAEVLKAFSTEKVKLHAEVQYYSAVRRKFVQSTPGRIMIAQLFPPESAFVYSSNMPEMSKVYINELIQFIHNVYGSMQTVKLCEGLMSLGFKFVSTSGLSFGSNFITRMHRVTRSLYKQARIASYIISNDFRDKRRVLSKVHSIWSVCINHASKRAEAALRESNWADVPEQILLNSKASGSIEQMNQIAVAKVSACSFSGRTCKMPIAASYYEGLSPMQMFYSTFSSRRSLIDTALKTATSGYFARKLVEALRECLVTEFDCGSTDGITYTMRDDVCTSQSSLVGRFLARPMVLRGGRKLTTTEMITTSAFKALTSEIDTVTVRSPITCLVSHGNVCSKCYGINLSTRSIAKVGDSVGVIAAQAISEPGTQLTLRTFHGSLTKTTESDGSLENKQILYAPYSGVIKFPNFPSNQFDHGFTVIMTSDCVLSILRSSNVLWKHQLKFGDRVFVQNDLSVTKGQALAFVQMSQAQSPQPVNSQAPSVHLKEFANNPKANSYSTITSLKSTAENKDNSPSLINPSLREINGTSVPQVSSSKPSTISEALLMLVDGSSEAPNSFFNPPAGFNKLSNLFNGSPSEIMSCLISFAKRNSKLTDVSEVDFVCPTFRTVGLFQHSDELIFQLSSNPISASSADDLFMLDTFVSLFINQVMDIYSLYGVNVNPKHLEIILNRMLNHVVVERDPSGTIPRWTEVEWSSLRNFNMKLISSGAETIVGVRRLINLTEMCNRNSSIFPDISVEGSIKSLALSVLNNQLISLDGIKNSLIIGKMPRIGNALKLTPSHETNLRKAPSNFI
ncbi:MAG: hypothetical protein ACTS4Z_00495 [Candidatus Hodgkinia cicadicola]